MPVTRMQQKRGTAAEWASTNPVLADGEIGFERDTGTIKVGNGYDTWQNLVPILRSVLAPTEAEWNANTRILTNGEVAIARDTQVIKVGDGTKTWSQLPSVLASTFVGTKGGDTIAAASATVVPLTLKAAASQTANLLEVRNNEGVVRAAIWSDGAIIAGGSTALGRLSSTATNAGDAPLVLKGAAGQSANMISVQNSAGTVILAVDPAGAITTSGHLHLKTGASFVTKIDTARVELHGSLPAAEVLRVRGAVSQTGNLTEWQDSGGGLLTRILNDGSFHSGVVHIRAGSNIPVGDQSIYAGSSWADRKIMVLRGSANQVSNLVEIQNSGGANMLAIAATGSIHGRFWTGSGELRDKEIFAGAVDSGGSGYRMLRIFN